MIVLGLAFIAAAGLLFAGLAVTHQPADDPYDHPYREVVPWP